MIKKIFLFLSTIIFILALGTFFYYYYNLYHHGNGSEQDFIVTDGQSIREISKNLKEKNIIDSSLVFETYAKFNHALIQIGTYKLSSNQNIKEILSVLSGGRTNENKVTIPEGWRVTQIDEYLTSKGFIKSGELTEIASADEGYLFPDTYRINPGIGAQDIKKIMIDNFWQKTKNYKITREMLILASIVEREAKFDQDRPIIAGVYLNRLEKNMRLEADPTIQYALGNWEPIKISNYHNVDSLYNTYLHNGLPPGPICNPGLKSIEAVLYPQKDGYLYFFHKKDGYAVFSNTLEEHQENLKKYQ